MPRELPDCTALTAGHFTVTFNGEAYMNPGDDVYFRLVHNGQNAGDEGRWKSSSGSTGLSRDMGSKTMVS